MSKYFVEVDFGNYKSPIKLRTGKGKTVEELKEQVENGNMIHPYQWVLKGGRGHVVSFSTWKTDRIPNQLIELFSSTTLYDIYGNEINPTFTIKQLDEEESSKVIIV